MAENKKYLPNGNEKGNIGGDMYGIKGENLGACCPVPLDGPLVGGGGMKPAS